MDGEAAVPAQPSSEDHLLRVHGDIVLCIRGGTGQPPRVPDGYLCVGFAVLGDMLGRGIDRGALQPGGDYWGEAEWGSGEGLAVYSVAVSGSVLGSIVG